MLVDGGQLTPLSFIVSNLVGLTGDYFESHREHRGIFRSHLFEKP